MARDPIRGKQSLWDHPGQLYSLGLSPPSAKMVTREGYPVAPATIVLMPDPEDSRVESEATQTPPADLRRPPGPPRRRGRRQTGPRVGSRPVRLLSASGSPRGAREASLAEPLGGPLSSSRGVPALAEHLSSRGAVPSLVEAPLGEGPSRRASLGEPGARRAPEY